MTLDELFDKFLSINYRLNKIKETIQREQQTIIHYQFRIQDPYTPYTLGHADLNVLDTLQFLVKQKKIILLILQKQKNNLKIHFDDLLIQILFIRRLSKNEFKTTNFKLHR